MQDISATTLKVVCRKLGIKRWHTARAIAQPLEPEGDYSEQDILPSNSYSATRCNRRQRQVIHQLGRLGRKKVFDEIQTACPWLNAEEASSVASLFLRHMQFTFTKLSEEPGSCSVGRCTACKLCGMDLKFRLSLLTDHLQSHLDYQGFALLQKMNGMR